MYAHMGVTRWLLKSQAWVLCDRDRGSSRWTDYYIFDYYIITLCIYIYIYT